jgi:K(+)-stimulated pyrophosphate-energized sodium pump
MKHISTLVREGARTFLHTEYQFIAVFVVAVFVALFFIADWQVAVSYLAGAIVSGTCGYCGMLIAVRANVRTTFACCDINERDENGVLKLDKDGGFPVKFCHTIFRMCHTIFNY